MPVVGGTRHKCRKIYDFATATRLLTELVADFSDQLADVRMVRPLSLANVLAEFADGN